eukprot:CAMPEP_0194035162 /NCGR_PEP_ID=MMETSP0009_2-20130614/7623_1 /TAXON_ID=210454 /ORGANISM="Grammatophora oceanica, Strain CCMP 410" /LENGTH=279 /DNA_ID=CAMNT_0038676417 /DNA_START=36 /DNA_END=875 /DNA_ORIENTATION=-
MKRMSSAIAAADHDESSCSSGSMAEHELQALHELMVWRKQAATGFAAAGSTTATETRTYSGRRRTRRLSSTAEEGTKPRKSKKRRVQFDDRVGKADSDDVIEGAHIWYSKQELASMKDEAKTTVRALRDVGWNPKALDESRYCLRGLEDWKTRTALRDKKSRIQNIVGGVLEEQANQKKMGISDPKGIQVLASACSKSARERALRIGVSDAQEARALLCSSPTLLQRRSLTATVLENALSLVEDGDVEKASDSLSSVASMTATLALTDQHPPGATARSA